VIIKIGDNVTVNKSWSNETRSGTVTEISISTNIDDPAGEAGMQVKEYDTNLDYSGSLSYKTESGDEYWAYLAQIQGDI
tara:strand:+ start:179 stop:415 length:237 start_codon:yes stop_codon:yes gene_type:complete